MDTDDRSSQQYLKDEKTGGLLKGTYGSGRKVGARAKIGEEFVSALRDDFLEHGAEAIIKVREQSPLGYLRVIAHLLPRDVNLNIRPLDDLSDEQLLRRLQQVAVLEKRSKSGLAAFEGGF